jgi:hypothetical protein
MATDVNDRELLRTKVLGWGLECALLDPGTDLGRDLRLTRGPTGLDFARVSGMNNLGQALAIALTTLAGSDVFNTEFGFDGLRAMAEETDPIMVRERIRIAVIQVLRKDQRVRQIVDVNLDDGRLQAATTGSRELGVSVAFLAATGDQTVIDVGKVVPHG